MQLVPEPEPAGKAQGEGAPVRSLEKQSGYAFFGTAAEEPGPCGRRERQLPAFPQRRGGRVRAGTARSWGSAGTSSPLGPERCCRGQIWQCSVLFFSAVVILHTASCSSSESQTCVRAVMFHTYSLIHPKGILEFKKKKKEASICTAV